MVVGEIKRCCTGPSYRRIHIAYVVIQVLEKRTRVQFVCESGGGVDGDDNLVVVAGRWKETG